MADDDLAWPPPSQASSNESKTTRKPNSAQLLARLKEEYTAAQASEHSVVDACGTLASLFPTKAHGYVLDAAVRTKDRPVRVWAASILRHRVLTIFR